jgi:hypothetical protein
MQFVKLYWQISIFAKFFLTMYALLVQPAWPKVELGICTSRNGGKRQVRHT